MSLKILFTTTFFSASFASGATLALFDFEGTEPDFFVFSDAAGAVVIEQQVPGAGGTDGIAVTVTGNPGSFAGAGLGAPNGPFDLGVAGIVAGAITEEDFDTITGSFDVNIPVGQQLTVRLEPAGGGFNERVDLGVTVVGTGSFQTVSFDVSAVSPAQRAIFVNDLNADGATSIQIVFNIDNPGGSAGSTFVFDNLSLSAVAVPEPTTSLLVLAGACSLLRRRR